MENKELVIYNEQGEIVECGFKRVDLSNPTTILNYCGDVKDAIGNILDSTAQMVIELDEMLVTEDDIKKIESFDISLEESEKVTTKKSIIRRIKKLLKKAGIEAFDDVLVEDNYASRFYKYCDLLNKVTVAVESQKQNTLNDIELKNNIIKEMEPLIKKLELMIGVGLKDKQKYDNETEQLKRDADISDIDKQHEIQVRTQVSAIFNNKLNELEKALILYKEQVQAYRIQQNSDMELVMSNDSYVKDSVPILKAQGSVMVFNKLQTKRIQRQQALDKATNNAVINNAKELEINAQAAVNLSVEGRIALEAIKEVENAIRNGIQIIKTGKKLRQEKNERERRELSKINEALDRYNEEFLDLAVTNQITVKNVPKTRRRVIGR